VLLAALAGVLIGHSSQAEPAAPPQKVSGAKLGFTAPAGWRRVSAPAVPGLDLDGAVAVADPETPGATIVAGIADGSGSRLLPSAFERRLPDAPKTDDPVKLGRLQAYRYRKLAPRGGPPLTVYASPLARDGVATVACLGPATDEDCDRAASTLALRSDLKPRPLGPARAYGAAVGSAIDRLGRERRDAQRALSRAKTSKGQAPRAKDVAAAYDKSANALEKAPAGPLEARANASLRTALLRARDAYRDLSSAAAKRRKADYSDARRQARRADDDARQAVAELDALGYEVD
jgi:hypothetical protein